jgi:hypothetical protein
LNYRIHPAVGIARVGNSAEYFIAPETIAGSPQQGTTITGGLPIRSGTESTPIRNTDLRDAGGALKRQAARFRIFAYSDSGEERWPRGDGNEVTAGSKIDGKTVSQIVWTVHMANKKANTFWLMENPPQGIASFEDGHVPWIRNAKFGNEDRDPNAANFPPEYRVPILNEETRVRELAIDPGPRTISGRDAGAVHFDRSTPASYFDSAQSRVVTLEHYPKSFPTDFFANMDAPSGPIESLGELQTDGAGRLLVLGGFGKATGWKVKGAVPLEQDVNNDQWFDDTSDGPVQATIVFDDGSVATVHSAWVACADPGNAPQIPNVVSMWDDVYDCWVRELGLDPELYDTVKGEYRTSFRPGFVDLISPILRSAGFQTWVANLSSKGSSAHRSLTAITAQDDPSQTPLAGLSVLRNPSRSDQKNPTLMPMHLGDGDDAFLSLTKTQYFCLQRWNEGTAEFLPGAKYALGPGEQLDKATLANCLGGRLSPGIDFTFSLREKAIFEQTWKTSGGGPFRIRAKALPYAVDLAVDKPLLTGGYAPRYAETDGLEPGDLSKFMAIPWHTDYNSCATHPPFPNPTMIRTVFWSWPAQRPVAVYALDDVFLGPPPNPGEALVPVRGQQRWSVRGEGTDSPDAENQGRYQIRHDMLENWPRIGVVMQAAAIEAPQFELPDDWYLEVEGKLSDTGQTPVLPFPNYASEPGDTPSPIQMNARELFFKLFNVSDHPNVLADARTFVDYWLKEAEKFSTARDRCPADLLFFPYTQGEFNARLDVIYQELVDVAATSDPGSPTQFIRTRADMIQRIVQWAPFNLIDGAWLRNIGQTGPMDEVRGLLYSICMDELGDGDISMNHCNIYRDLCHSVGYYPPQVESEEFAFDPRFLDSGFLVPAFQLAISQFTQEYLPELIGMTLQLEWEVVDLKPTRDLLTYFGFDPHFYVMHIGIDNAVNGHGRRAADAVSLYLEDIRKSGGEAAVQVAWQRIWNGFVAFSSLPFDLERSFAQDLRDLITSPPSLRDQMMEMILRKAPMGSRNHQSHTIGGTRIDDWFDNPAGFLEALQAAEWIIPGDWDNSRMKGLLDFETGPMFRVFTDDEIALWKKYVTWLKSPTPPPTPPLPPLGAAMVRAIDKLRKVQRGVPEHNRAMLAGPDGRIQSVKWWFEQPTVEFLRVLAASENGLITPGRPNESRFYTNLIAPTGPMGSIFSLAADPPFDNNNGTYRDLVRLWIEEGCPIPSNQLFRLRLNTMEETRQRHPTGRMYGMGAIH